MTFIYFCAVGPPNAPEDCLNDGTFISSGEDCDCLPEFIGSRCERGMYILPSSLTCLYIGE